MSNTYIQGVVLRQVCVSKKAPRMEHLGLVKYGVGSKEFAEKNAEQCTG